MNWLTPGTALIAAGVAVPALVILYFLKLRRRDVEVSTTLLWKKSIEDLQANAPFQKLRRNILLLLQLLALAACLVAIAQPESRADRPPPSRVVIVIDRSLSMSTLDETDTGGRGMTRLEKAKAGAIAQVQALPDADMFSGTRAGEAMVIAFDSQATVVHPFSADKNSLRTAIEGITPSDAPTDFAPVMRVAGSHIGPRRLGAADSGAADADSGYAPGEPVELWTDGDVRGLDAALLHPDAVFNYNRVGADGAENFAIVAMRSGRTLDDPGKASVFVGVQSTAKEARTVDVELTIDGALVSVRGVDLPAADEQTGFSQSGVVFRLDRSAGALVTARLAVDDVLKPDNQAIVVLPPARRFRVLLVSPGNFPLRSALEAMPLSELRELTPGEYSGAAGNAQALRYDVVVLDRTLPSGMPEAPAVDPATGAQTTPLDAADAGAVVPGNYLMFGAAPAFRGVRPGATRETPEGAVILDWQRDHPVLRPITLDPLTIYEQVPIETTDEARVLARSTEGPAIIEASLGGARAIIVAFDALESSWPFDLNFVLFVASAVRYLGGEDDIAGGSGFRPGETLSSILPTGITEAELLTPDSGRHVLRAGPDGRVSFAPIDRAGLYTLRWQGSPGAGDFVEGDRVLRHLPANILDNQESRALSLEAVSLPRGEVREGNRAEGQTKRRWWPWLVLTMLVILMVEWYIYNRKVYL